VGGGDGPLGDETGSIAVFQAVSVCQPCSIYTFTFPHLTWWRNGGLLDLRNDNLLNITDLVGSISETPRSLIRRSPKTEIIDRVDVDVLT